MNHLPVIVVLAAAAGWSLLDAVGPPARPWFGALVAGVLAFEVVATRSSTDARDDRIGGWRRVELLALLAGVPLIRLLAGSADLDGTAGRPVDAETVAGWLVGLAVWLLVQATVADLDAVERGLEGVDGPSPASRIRARFVVVGLLTIAASGYASIGLDGLLDLGRPAAHAVPWAAVLYLAVGLPAVGSVALAANRARWRRDGAAVDADVARRWRAATAVVVAVVLAVGLAAPLFSRGVSALPARLVAEAGGLGDWLVATLDRLGSGGSTRPAAGEGTGGEGASPGAVGRPAADYPDWIGEAALVVIVGVLFAFVIARGRQARLRDGSPVVAASQGRVVLWLLVRGLAEIALSVARALAALVAWVGGLLRRRVRPESAAGPPAARPRRPGLWSPGDGERARIVRAHRAFAAAAAEVVGRRRPAETAAEFGRRVEPATRRLSDVRDLTGLYEEARYSTHRLGESEAARAEGAAGRVVGDLTPDPEPDHPG